MPGSGETTDGGVIGPDAEGIFSALVSEPDIGVAVISSSQQIVFINRWASRFYLDREPDGVVGQTTDVLFGAEVAAADLANMALARETGKPLLMRWMWKGKQVRVTFRRLAEDGDSPEQFLTVHRLIRAGDDDAFAAGTEFEPREAELIELGPLDALTPREIEVLALIGQGLSIKEIARALGRSAKTVDNHRHSIGRKLDASDRFELVQVAREAGLRVDDAQRERIRGQIE